MHHPFAELIGLVFEEQSKGESVCTLKIVESLFNPQKVIHGGVLYTLADTGMGGALYPILEEGGLCATIEIKIAYFKPVREGKLICKSKLIQRGKRVAFLESEIFNDEVLAAKATGSFSIFNPKKS